MPHALPKRLHISLCEAKGYESFLEKPEIILDDGGVCLDGLQCLTFTREFNRVSWQHSVIANSRAAGALPRRRRLAGHHLLFRWP
jgi:hypothetical protein